MAGGYRGHQDETRPRRKKLFSVQRRRKNSEEINHNRIELLSERLMLNRPGSLPLAPACAQTSPPAAGPALLFRAALSVGGIARDQLKGAASPWRGCGGPAHVPIKELGRCERSYLDPSTPDPIAWRLPRTNRARRRKRPMGRAIRSASPGLSPTATAMIDTAPSGRLFMA